MAVRRKELTKFVSACEHLISVSLTQSFDDDDRALVEFYTHELIKHFELRLPTTGAKPSHNPIRRLARF